MEEDIAIRFKGVSKSFGKNLVFDSINLDIPRRKITGILGASGEGKSTLLKMMIYFYKPSKGKIYYSGKEIFNNLHNLKEDFGIAIEDGSFYENLTVKENLFHFGKLYHVDRKTLRKRIDAMISFVDLENSPNVLAKDLSLGMKKRLDIACALIHKPSVLILDEPTADLDPVLRKHLLLLIRKINDHGTTVIFTTQLMEEVEEVCDKIAILSNQKIIEQGSPDSIKRKYGLNDMNKVFEKIFLNTKKGTYKELSKEEIDILFYDEEEMQENQIKEENKRYPDNKLNYFKRIWDNVKEKIFRKDLSQDKKVTRLNKDRSLQKNSDEKSKLNKYKEIK